MKCSNPTRGPLGVDELRRALDGLVDSLPLSQRTPSIKACLAQQLASLAMANKIRSIEDLSEVALRDIANKCQDCHGCDGINVQRPAPENRKK